MAYGLGRGELNAPLRVVEYPLTLDAPTEVRTFPTERSQMNFMKAAGNQVTVTFFSSKYETETGKLIREADRKWRYEKTLGIRMGTSTDIYKDALLLGRMYGDSQPQDGDLLVKQGKNDLAKQPSYRGVSTAVFYPSSPDGAPAILMGDGWHSNYGQVAEARLSMLLPVPGTQRYALDLLHVFEGSYAVTRIFPTASDRAAPVLLTTNNHLYLGKPGDNWRFTELYTQKNADKVFEVQYLGSIAGELYLVVNDDGVILYKTSGR